MEYFYFVITQENENKKTYSTPIKVPGCYNLLSFFDRFKNLKSITAFKTQKEAVDCCNFWNDAYISNGNYIFNKNYKFVKCEKFNN